MFVSRARSSMVKTQRWMPIAFCHLDKITKTIKLIFSYVFHILYCIWGDLLTQLQFTSGTKLFFQLAMITNHNFHPASVGPFVRYICARSYSNKCRKRFETVHNGSEYIIHTTSDLTFNQAIILWSSSGAWPESGLALNSI